MSQPSRPPVVPPHLAAMHAEMVRERFDPVPGDPLYPHLRDLRDAVRDVVADASGIWLDYGSATSPYRGLFTGARLHTSDIASTSWKYANDYPLEEDGRIPAPDASFDGVLSTQVLEHALDPAVHLREAMRVLKPGGRLVLTTHGVWEDHGPVDLWRWTAEGLQAQVEATGFAIDRCWTLTCGARAVLHLALRQGRAAHWPASGPAGLLLRAVRALDRWRPSLFDHYSDRRLWNLRRADAGEHGLYLALLVSARRPSAT
jgi:SAM-dependent methyltransferase